MHYFTARRTRLVLIWTALALSLGVAAQGPTPSRPRPAHQVAPDAPVQPDYFAQALAHTSFTDDPAWRPLHLHVAGRTGDPAYIVLPVQTQAFGFAPPFRALLGARLDQELQRRRIDASRQTDIVDWRGPFVRRSDDATVATFGDAHARSTLLTLTLGHDGDGHALLALALTAGKQSRIVHRRIDLPQDLVPMLDAFTAMLPPMLAELGLGSPVPAAPLPGAAGATCYSADWILADVPLTASPRDIACHALLMGSLMPDFASRFEEVPRAGSPDRLAWLARAWVEGSAMSQQSPAMKSVATLAALQLRLDLSINSPAGLIDDQDVVVRPLARIMWAHKRARTLPTKSPAVTAYAKAATAELPAFAAAVGLERATFDEPFRRTDLCTMQLIVPHMRTPETCETSKSDAVARQAGTPSQAQAQLLDAWRLGAAWNDIYIEGYVRGDARGLESLLADLPVPIANHPFTREMRFVARRAETRVTGADAHLTTMQARMRSHATAVATLQRDDFLLGERGTEDLTLLNEKLDPALLRIDDDLHRLELVSSLDLHGQLQWQPRRHPTLPATWLVDGNFWNAEQEAEEQLRNRLQATLSPFNLQDQTRLHPPRPDPSSAPMAAQPPTDSHGAPRHVLSPGVFNLGPPFTLPSKESLQKQMAANAYDMSPRVGLALLALEQGATVAEARRVIDARPQLSRTRDALGETEAWALAATPFYFTGHLDVAREYYARAVRLNTGSGDDLMSRLRLAEIAGDVRGALAGNQAIAERYDDEWAIANQAAFLFMLGHAYEGWELLLPRMQSSDERALWRSALVGHRITANAPALLPDWLTRNRLETVAIDYNTVAPDWLHYAASFDRLPVLPSSEALRATAAVDLADRWVGGLATMKAAIDAKPVATQAALDHDVTSTVGGIEHLLPFHAWNTWNASQGKDPTLEVVRGIRLEAGLQAVLAKAMVLAADGKRDEALRFLTAARYELGRRGTPFQFRDEFRTTPYEFVLATWLMTRQTHDQAYALQGLAISRAYQHAEAFLAWPYAAEALLGNDPKARQVAACRAQRLDPGSMMLHESGLHPDAKSAVCRKAVAW